MQLWGLAQELYSDEKSTRRLWVCKEQTCVPWVSSRAQHNGFEMVITAHLLALNSLIQTWKLLILWNYGFFISKYILFQLSKCFPIFLSLLILFFCKESPPTVTTGELNSIHHLRPNSISSPLWRPSLKSGLFPFKTSTACLYKLERERQSSTGFLLYLNSGCRLAGQAEYRLHPIPVQGQPKIDNKCTQYKSLALANSPKEWFSSILTVYSSKQHYFSLELMIANNFCQH